MIIVLKWIVIEWNKIWRKLWFKTANIVCNNELILEWTYKINVKINLKKYSWVWTFIKSKWVFESHIFNFDKDIYWKKIEIYILDKIRENIKFENFVDLKKQISKDILFAKKKSIDVITFWTFDIFHLWHKHFLKQASFYWDKLITIVATDKNVLNLKGFKPKNNEIVRKEIVEKSRISDIVELWSNLNPLYCLDKYNPNIVCLGYDQVWFISLLLKDTMYSWINIVRLKSYKKNIYKSSLLNK